MTKQPEIDTIYALASASGRAGIAIVRVSGPAATISLAVFTGANDGHRTSGGKKADTPPPSNRLRLCKIKWGDNDKLIDTGMVVFFKAPASYTGEDVVEYHTHGGPAVVQELLEALSVQPGHRLAEPGEFTRRAFENGKLNLTEAEAIADLINAETQMQKSQALSQMEGSLSRLYDHWRKELTSALAHTEADIEFPDEDLPGTIIAQMHPIIEKMMAELEAHLNDSRRGEILRGGVHVAVIGAPNAGKSSLVNALAQRDVAIVSELAGTTRDIIEVHLDLGGYPVILADTAGLRPSLLSLSPGGKGEEGCEGNKIESEGIRRALKRAEQADIRLLLFDGTQEADRQTIDLIDKNAILAVNKLDCHPEGPRTRSGGLKDLMNKGDFSPSAQNDIVEISAKTGEGLEELINTLINKVKMLVGQSETPALTRQRHRKALEECQQALIRALEAELPELMAEDMRLSIRCLGRITGSIDVEDLLDVIFRDFCIGK